MRIISGEWRSRRFDVPREIEARPTTDMARENLFNVLGNLLDFDGLQCVDLFAGTGAVTFEMLSRGAAHVTAVEKASLQQRFITKVATTLDCQSRLTRVRGDVFKFLENASKRAQGTADFVFADPPYDLPRFDDVAPMVLDSGILKPGGLFVLEHSAKRDYSRHPLFDGHRAYGSVNFSFFEIPEGQ